MNRDSFEQFIDLRRVDLDPELFAAALVVQYLCRLLASGGSAGGCPDDDAALLPQHLEPFLERAVETAKKTKRFEHEWRRLQRLVPSMKVAWELGKTLFQEALTRATNNEEDMGYLSQIDFAADCYASISECTTYPHDRALQAWAINGYMGAWRQHFLAEEDTSL